MALVSQGLQECVVTRKRHNPIGREQKVKERAIDIVSSKIVTPGRSLFDHVQKNALPIFIKEEETSVPNLPQRVISPSWSSSKPNLSSLYAFKEIFWRGHHFHLTFPWNSLFEIVLAGETVGQENICSHFQCLLYPIPSHVP